MDAKVGDQVITPRTGKPVEVNALWYNALRTMARFAFELEQIARRLHSAWPSACRRASRDSGMRRRVAASTCSMAPRRQRSLPCGPTRFSPCRCRKVRSRRAAHGRGGYLRAAPGHAVTACERSTPPIRAIGALRRPPAERDAAYHQGTVWAWLLGPSCWRICACIAKPQAGFQFPRTDGAAPAAQGVGSISEIFDGDPPHHPRGAIAQAWSVAEVLRAWRACHDAGLTAQMSPSPHGALGFAGLLLLFLLAGQLPPVRSGSCGFRSTGTRKKLTRVPSAPARASG